MWKIIELLVLIGIVLIFITEFFIPILTGKPVFGSFRKSKTVVETDEETTTEETTEATAKETLDEKISKAKEKVNEVKLVQDEIDQHFKTAEQLKEESDNLLNK